MSGQVEFFIRGDKALAEPYRYAACGLDNVYLLNGVALEETDYGPMVTIEKLNALHRAIGLHIIEKAEPMSGPEFRFLRKEMELTQRELAAMMKISGQTIANYEKGNTSLGPADPLMRITYLLHIIPGETRAKLLRATTGALPSRIPSTSREKLVQDWQEGRKAA
jgi:DNA-binding transcriptional regulator YiaG